MVGKRIRELRDAKKLSRKDLAKHLGVTDRTVGFYESEERNPPIDILNKLADIFDVSVDYLLGRTDIPNLYSLYREKGLSENQQLLCREKQISNGKCFLLLRNWKNLYSSNAKVSNTIM